MWSLKYLGAIAFCVAVLPSVAVAQEAGPATARQSVEQVDKSKKPRPRNHPGGWVRTTDYGQASIRNREVGTAQFTVEVGVDGRVSKCTINSGTASLRLKQQTCILVKRRARFYPALDVKGNQTEGNYTSAVRWQIPDPFYFSAAEKGWEWPEEVSIYEANRWEVKFRAEISPEGQIASCAILESSGNEILDNATCANLRNSTDLSPGEKGGQPVTREIVSKAVWKNPVQWAPIGEGEFAGEGVIETDGSISSCNLTKFEGPLVKIFEGKHICAELLVEDDIKVKPILDDEGNPVRTKMTVRLSVEREHIEVDKK